MGFIKYSNVEIINVLNSDEDGIFCVECGGIMKRDNCIYMCDDCGSRVLLTRRDNEQLDN